jgi:adenylosuccinate lyase
MPHKVNARNCERICGFSTILSGYVTMTGALSGHQWNEGDVSCSVVRRVALPDAFYAIDGLLETLLAVLNQMDVFEAAIGAEIQRQLPFLATTTILMEAVKAGVGRETAHLAIKKTPSPPPRPSAPVRASPTSSCSSPPTPVSACPKNPSAPS